MSDGASVELLADHPTLLREAGLLRWAEWGYDDPSPDEWIEITVREAGRGDLPLTLVAINDAGRTVGIVGLDDIDDALIAEELAGRTPWLVGMVVRRDSRRLGIGRLLMEALAVVAQDHGHDHLWVVTGGDAVDYYRACGWTDAEQLVTEKEQLPSTVLTWTLPG
jgi:GNAT superfamily N-acetyltransferase